MAILPNMAKTVKKPLFHYFFAFYHILRCPYHEFSGHRAFLTHFWAVFHPVVTRKRPKTPKIIKVTKIPTGVADPRGGGGVVWFVHDAVQDQFHLS